MTGLTLRIRRLLGGVGGCGRCSAARRAHRL
jgi:hypothetical protein